MRRHLTYANVVSTLCLFLLLGGISFAATKLGKNTVGTKQIRNGQVKKKDLANDAVTSQKVANGSLLGEDFAAGQLPQGEQGPAGATRVTVRRGAAVTVAPGGTNTATANCMPGERATGGGWEVEGYVTLNDYANRPIQNAGETPVGWKAGVWAPTGATGDVRAYVICAAP